MYICQMLIKERFDHHRQVHSLLSNACSSYIIHKDTPAISHVFFYVWYKACVRFDDAVEKDGNDEPKLMKEVLYDFRVRGSGRGAQTLHNNKSFGLSLTLKPPLCLDSSV